MNQGLQVLYEDNHLIAVHKRSGQTVQPEPGKPKSLEEEVKEYIKIHYQKPGAVFLGVIHRLDLPVSGVVLFAKTSKALTRMNERFRSREVIKIYEATVDKIPDPPEAGITHWLVRDAQKNISKAYKKEVAGSEKAELTYRLIAEKGNEIKLQIELHSGRKHQIRVQLSAIGCPIVGDVKYGSTKKLKNGEIALRSVQLQFVHPVTLETVVITDTLSYTV